MKKLIILVFFGLFYNYVSGQRNEKEVVNQSMKYQYFMAYINRFYVDTVNLEKLTETAMVKILSELDPHSVYIPEKEVAQMNEPLSGGFFGIGIQFTIIKDTLNVVQVILGGPSEKSGLLPGDRIIGVGGENIAGVGLTNARVQEYLRGPKGSIAELEVLRKERHMHFKIVRDKIPIHSVEAAYMVDDKIGYINISRFSANTLEELENALRKLNAEGMTDLILDLGRNGGGFLGAAIGVADHLLDRGKLIVYTDGVEGRKNQYSTHSGLFKKGRTVVLMDENSASSSEIVAGAVQDWDRGLIVGRRSFGKGLVQQQFPFPDGSMMRLTTAFYYTPSGRCIQKPYKDKDYELEVWERYKSGEMTDQGKIRVNDSLKYYTKIKGRLVYGGGGISPDVFVPIDTTLNYFYANNLIASGSIREFLSEYLDKNRDKIKNDHPDSQSFLKNFTVTDAMLDELMEIGKKNKVDPISIYRAVKLRDKIRDIKAMEEAVDTKKNPPTEEEINQSMELYVIPIKDKLKRDIKAMLGSDLWGTELMFRIMNEDSEIFKTAVRLLQSGEYDKLL